jgi:trehalose-phosphatase
VKHLFKDWKHVRARIRQARYLFLFLDYDGTLTPIVSVPEKAFCPPEVKKNLERLRDLPGVHPVVISGRSLEDVREKIGVSGIFYVGNHGLEIAYPDGNRQGMLPSAKTRDLKKITRDIKKSLRDIPGILFEEKGPILAVHYRNVARRYLAFILEALEEELQQRKRRWQIAAGKKVFEIRPSVDFNKGKAVQAILKSFCPQEVFSICLGDDQTDEDAFREIKGRGISVFIGSAGSPSAADYYLRDSVEVQRFLSRCHRARRACGETPGIC